MDDSSSTQSGAKRDVVIVVVAMAVILALAVVFDFHEAWVRWAAEHEQWEIDEILPVLSLAAVFFGWFALRRWRASSLEIRRRIEVHGQLVREITERERAEETLREREVRIRGIMDNVVDGIITIDESGTIESFNPAAERLFGYAASEAIGRNVSMLMPEPDRGNHDDYLDAYRRSGTGKILGVGPREVTGLRKDGSTFAMDLATSEMRLGTRRVFIGVTRDVTERKMGEETLHRKSEFVRLLQKIAVAANEATTIDEALQASLDIVCVHMDWPVGHVYLLNDPDGGELVSSGLWHLDDPEAFDVFRRLTESRRFDAGEGLPGRVLASGAPEWIGDVTEHAGFLRARMAVDIGVKSGFAVPVLVGDSPIAVLEFFSAEAMEPSNEALDVMRHVGTQLGRVFERNEAEKTLSKSRETLRTVIDAVPAVINAKNIDGRYIFVNAHHAKLRNVRPQDAIGKTARDLAAGHAAWVRETDRQVIDTGEPIVNMEYADRDDGGTPITRLVTKVPVRDASGAVGSIVTVAFDITERKKAEDRLRAAMEAAEAANRAKGEFLAIAGHELRTPLNAILGFSEILSEQMFGPMENERYVGYAGDIHRSGKRLLGIINDILEISRAEAAKLELEEDDVDIRAVIDDVVRLVEADVEKSGVELTIDVDDALPRLNGDARQIKQILSNLLTNAIKFTPAPGTVRLNARRYDNGRLVIAIRDSGIGIAAEDISKALAPFGQVDSKLERQFEGLGLGLPLAKSMVELHGGTLKLKSEPGIGTTVTVEFPAERVVTGRTAAA